MNFRSALERYLEINGWKRLRRPGQPERWAHPGLGSRILHDAPTAITRTAFAQEMLGRAPVSVTLRWPTV